MMYSEILKWLASIAIFSLCACMPEQHTQPDEARHDLQQSDLNGEWELISVNGQLAGSAKFDDGNEIPRLSFGPPCYETGDGHCNPAMTKNWDPSLVRNGRLSISGYSGCNWFGAEAYVSGNILYAEPVMSTERGCPSITQQEKALYTVLADNPRLSIHSGLLEIAGKSGARIRARKRVE